jgi:hypothetical protein
MARSTSSVPTAPRTGGRRLGIDQERGHAQPGGPPPRLGQDGVGVRSGLREAGIGTGCLVGGEAAPGHVVGCAVDQTQAGFSRRIRW